MDLGRKATLQHLSLHPAEHLDLNFRRGRRRNVRAALLRCPLLLPSLPRSLRSSLLCGTSRYLPTSTQFTRRWDNSCRSIFTETGSWKPGQRTLLRAELPSLSVVLQLTLPPVNTIFLLPPEHKTHSAHLATFLQPSNAVSIPPLGPRSPSPSSLPLPENFGEGSGVLGRPDGDEGLVRLSVSDSALGARIMGEEFRSKMMDLAGRGECESFIFFLSRSAKKRGRD